MGAAIVNDFKSMEGDRAFGLKSLPLLLGVDCAKWMAALMPDTVQLATALYLYSIGESVAAALIVAAVLPQTYFQATLLIPGPLENDVKYMVMSQPFSFLAVLATAWGIGHHQLPTSM